MKLMIFNIFTPVKCVMKYQKYILDQTKITSWRNNQVLEIINGKVKTQNMQKSRERFKNSTGGYSFPIFKENHYLKELNNGFNEFNFVKTFFLNVPSAPPQSLVTTWLLRLGKAQGNSTIT